MEKKKGVVYSIPCMDCNSVYVGETGRNLEKRLKEHQYAVKIIEITKMASQYMHGRNHTE